MKSIRRIRTQGWHVKESKVHITESPMTSINIGELPVMLEFKIHLMYDLRDDLLKLEAIYPPDAPPLRFVKAKQIHGRECVHVLHSSDIWLKGET